LGGFLSYFLFLTDACYSFLLSSFAAFLGFPEASLASDFLVSLAVACLSDLAGPYSLSPSTYFADSGKNGASETPG